MWSDESRFTLFHSDGCIRLRRETDEVMYPSCLEPAVQACGGSAMIWSCCSWSGLGSATSCAQKMRSANHLTILVTRLYHQWMFSSLMARAYSKMTMPGFIGLKL